MGTHALAFLAGAVVPWCGPPLHHRRPLAAAPTSLVCRTERKGVPAESQNPRRPSETRPATQPPKDDDQLLGYPVVGQDTKQAFRREKARGRASEDSDDLIDDGNAPAMLQDEIAKTKERLRELEEKIVRDAETVAPPVEPLVSSSDGGSAMRAQLDYALAMMAGAGFETEGGKFGNLIPFAKTRKTETCKPCNGEGMCVCDYCKGVGFVKFDTHQNPLKITFKGIDVYRATPASGELHYCPFCGGLKKERCMDCFGSGRIRADDHDPDISDPPQTPEDAIREIMDDPQRNTEVSRLGVNIVRRRRKRTPKKKPAEAQDKSLRKSTSDPSRASGKRRRGRPRKEDSVDLDTELTLGLERAASKKRDITGFFNTTMYKVGRDLADGKVQEEEQK